MSVAFPDYLHSYLCTDEKRIESVSVSPERLNFENPPLSNPHSPTPIHPSPCRKQSSICPFIFYFHYMCFKMFLTSRPTLREKHSIFSQDTLSMYRRSPFVPLYLYRAIALDPGLLSFHKLIDLNSDSEDRDLQSTFCALK